MAAIRGRNGGRTHVDPAGARIARLLLALVSARGRGLTVAELREVGGSRATVYRDLDAIRAGGWELVIHHDDGDGRRARYRVRRPR